MRRTYSQRKSLLTPRLADWTGLSWFGKQTVDPSWFRTNSKVRDTYFLQTKRRSKVQRKRTTQWTPCIRGNADKRLTQDRLSARVSTRWSRTAHYTFNSSLSHTWRLPPLKCFYLNLSKPSGLGMRSVTWNRFPIESNFLIDYLFISFEENSCSNTDMCTF